MSTKDRTERRDWPRVLAHATEIVHEYEDLITLRQLFYRLVADGTLPNTVSAYKGLSRTTAAARREDGFPRLVDRTREIERQVSFDSPEAARRWLRTFYRRDRTEGQVHNVYLGVEKDALAGLLSSWFRGLGVGIVALRGYSSESLYEALEDEMVADGRPAVMFYAGDFDPTGEDISRDAEVRGRGMDVRRIALGPEQVEQFDLPPLLGKASDSRASAFVAKHGRLVQVELDALPPDALRALYEDALADYWDKSAYEAAVALEGAEKEEL